MMKTSTLGNLKNISLSAIRKLPKRKKMTMTLSISKTSMCPLDPHTTTILGPKKTTKIK